MIIALLIRLLLSMMSGGPEEAFLVPNLEKEIKRNVSDQDKKKEILILVKVAKKEMKAFNKLRSKKMKTMKKSGASRVYTSVLMEEEFMSYHRARLELQASMIRKRIQFQELLTQEEWDKVIADAVFPSEKAMKKSDKAEEKQEKEIDKIFSKIEVSIEKNIADEEIQEPVLKQLQIFRATFDDFLSASEEIQNANDEIARNRGTTKSQLEEFYRLQNELRVKGAKAFFDFRTTAIENTTEKEWKKMVDEMKAFFE